MVRFASAGLAFTDFMTLVNYFYGVETPARTGTKYEQ